MRLKNENIINMIEGIKPFLDRRDIVGYASARNMRVLAETSTEYRAFRDEAIKRHGEEVKDEEGNVTGIKVKEEEIQDFIDEIKELAEIEHEVELYKIDIEKAVNVLSGNELLELYWMFEGE